MTVVHSPANGYHWLIKSTAKCPESSPDLAGKRYIGTQEIEIKANINKNKTLQNIFKSLKEYHYDDNEDSISYLGNHPLVTAFKSSIESELQEKYQRNDKEEAIRYFGQEFDALFEDKTEHDTDIQKIEEIIQRKVQYNDRRIIIMYHL